MLKIRSLLWLMPFASFLTGYLLISLVIKQPALITPTLTGKTLDQAVLILSQSNLNIRIVGQKEDAQLPEGTILTQTPAPNTSIKEQQALYVTIAKKPIPLAMPHLVGKTETQAIAELEALSLHAQIYKVSSDQPTHTVIAQSPEPGLSANSQALMLYVATDEQKPILMPNLKNRPLDEVLSFLELEGITPTLLHTPVGPDHRCNNCMVIDQRPLSGCFINKTPTKIMRVQLQISEQ